MHQLINQIIENKGNNHFEFNGHPSNPVKHLKEQSKAVPNTAGLYLVFTPQKSQEVCKNCAHLYFNIAGQPHELLYFGKAGGFTKTGKVITQGLNGRINNVVSESSRNLKDVKRGAYWNIVMNEFNFQKLTIIYFQHNNPQTLEDVIYSFLDGNNLKYPLMNKRRGR